MLHMFHTYVVSVFIWMLRMFAIVFHVCFANVSYACFECFSCFVYMLQGFYLNVFFARIYLNVSKVNRGYYACCNMSHLPQPRAAALRVLSMEGDGAVGMEGRGKQENVREQGGAGSVRACSRCWCRRPEAEVRPSASPALDGIDSLHLRKPG